MSNPMDIHIVLSLFHLALVVPLFLFVGYQRADTPRWIYLSLLSLGGILAVYHGMKMVRRWYSGSPSLWISAIHTLFIAPLLLYIGYHGRDAPRAAYELLLIAGFGAGGYHMFQLVTSLQVYQ